MQRLKCQIYNGNLEINIVEDIIVFLGLNCLQKNCAGHFCRETTVLCLDLYRNLHPSTSSGSSHQSLLPQLCDLYSN